jgi:hypothetical protein
MKIIVQCAWCHKIIGYKYSEIWDELVPKTTHSICSNCYKNLIDETNSLNLSADVTFDGGHSNMIMNKNVKSASKTI